MDNENTQADGPMTQREVDPRRLGRNNSGLTEEDVSDVLCILHPSSRAAYRIVEQTARRNPQHVLQNRGLIPFGEDGQLGSPDTELSTIHLDPSDTEQPQDLALRFSSRVYDPTRGFCFGRNQMKCDINLDADDNQKRVSNMHFRVYVNNSGIIMIEDMSTNGTVVDTITLGGKRHTGNDKTRMLVTGSVIEILAVHPEEVIKFIVRVPPRDQHALDYYANLRRYLEHVAIAEGRIRTANEGAPIPEGAIRGMLAAPLAGPANTKPIPSTVPASYKSNYGMHWDGDGEYNCVGVLGKGAFATVYHLATVRDGNLYAGKELQKKRFMKNGVLDLRLNNELSIMKELRHENIVQYTDVRETKDHLYIIMEYVPCGDLQGYMGAHGTLPEDRAKRMTQQILSALSYLHLKGITHRDIKPDNILICSDEPFNVKLTDFGLSKVVKNNETFLKTFCGTLLYCAPEVFPHYDNYVAGIKPKRRRHSSGKSYRYYGQLVDVWSYAAVLWFVLCGKPPFEGVNDGTGRAMFERIVETNLDPTPLREASISEDCIDLLLRMLTVDPTSRPTDIECLSHRWLNDGVTLSTEGNVGLGIISEELEPNVDDLDAGKLSIHDVSDGPDNAGEDSSTSRDFDEGHIMKKQKSEGFNQLREQTEMPSSSENSYHSMIPIVNGVAGENLAQSAPPKPQRLFGEIGDSALRSSGVLGKQEDIAGETPNDSEDNATSSPHEAITASGASAHQNSSRQGGAFDGTNSSAQGKPLATTSLYGAESMVRELHMASPESSTTALQSPRGFATATTPENQVTPRAKANGASTNGEHGTQDKTPRQPNFSRQIDLGPPTASYYFDPYKPDTHSVEYATRVSGINFFGDPTASSANHNDELLPDTTDPSFSSNNDGANDVGKSNGAEPHRPTAEAPLSVINPSADDEFIKPTPPLGHLTTTPDSFSHQTLTLHNRVTSWGRNPGSTIPYPSPHDTRVPKTGLEIWFHAKGIENIEATGEPDWRNLANLSAIVRTRSSKGIKVNGIELKEKESENGRALYGHLRTGDEITVYEHGGSKLKFHCEFFVGTAKTVRGPTEPRFEVLRVI